MDCWQQVYMYLTCYWWTPNWPLVICKGHLREELPRWDTNVVSVVVPCNVVELFFISIDLIVIMFKYCCYLVFETCRSLTTVKAVRTHTVRSRCVRYHLEYKIMMYHIWNKSWLPAMPTISLVTYVKHNKQPITPIYYSQYWLDTRV